VKEEPMAFGNREKDGGATRPFLFLAIFLIATNTATAWEDVFQAALGLDYERLWMKPDPCRKEPLIEALPDLQREGAPCAENTGSHAPPPVSASLGLNHQNLIGKTGDFAFAHDGTESTLDLRLNLMPGLEIRSSMERAYWNRNIGDTSIIKVDENGSIWQSRHCISFPLNSRLVPFVSAGWNSKGGWENALALRGSDPIGLSWSMAVGRQAVAYPVTLTLPDYLPMSAPLLLKQDIYAFSLGLHRGILALAWTSRLRMSERPSNPGGYYILSDSGYGLKHIADLTFADSGSKGHYRASVEGEYNSGRHVFLGVKNSDASSQFGYEDTRNRDYSIRADARAGKNRWEAGAFLGAFGLYWDALRPSPAYDKYFWDKNEILDSYEGNIFGIFSHETWLFDGSVSIRQWAAGAWVAWITSHWRGQFGMAYNLVDMKAHENLSRKTTTLLIAYTEKDYVQSFPGIRAHLLTPEFRWSGRRGRAFAEASLVQALPIHVQTRGQNGSSDQTIQSGSSYSGGTRIGVKMGWGVF
jgi:hypothetical protein